MSSVSSFYYEIKAKSAYLYYFPVVEKFTENVMGGVEKGCQYVFSSGSIGLPMVTCAVVSPGRVHCHFCIIFFYKSIS